MITKIAEVASYLEAAVVKFTDLAVIGTSGGVDSSVVASICVAALGAENVYLVSMPFDQHDVATFNSRSAELALRLKAKHSVVPVGASCNALVSELNKVFVTSLDKLTPANVRPRIRMTVLYGIAGELGYKSGNRVRVMGTGHMSEDLIGYDTKGGDALADLFVLSDLLKSEVYQLAEHYGVPQSIIAAAPSAGLYPGQTDAEELGFTYDELEPATLALSRLISQGASPDAINPSLAAFAGLNPEHVKFVVGRYRIHYHKHMAPAGVPCRNKDWFD